MCCKCCDSFFIQCENPRRSASYNSRFGIERIALIAVWRAFHAPQVSPPPQKGSLYWIARNQLYGTMLQVTADRTSGRRSSSIGCRSIIGRRTSVYINQTQHDRDPFKVSNFFLSSCGKDLWAGLEVLKAVVNRSLDLWESGEGNLWGCEFGGVNTTNPTQDGSNRCVEYLMNLVCGRSAVELRSK